MLSVTCAPANVIPYQAGATAAVRLMSRITSSSPRSPSWTMRVARKPMDGCFMTNQWFVSVQLGVAPAMGTAEAH